MERNQQQKKRRVAFNPRQTPTQKDIRRLLNKLEKIMDKFEYGPPRQRSRAKPARCQATVAFASTSAPSDPREMLSVRTKFDRNEVPVFNTYEEFHKTVLQSFENISIVLNIEGKIVFISQNVSPLLGHRPEDIVGKTLLNILLDEEKEEISQKVILNLPLADSVGNLIEFCCYVRKGNAGLDAQDTYDYRDVYEERDTYEYVKFILYLQDCYDESFIFFGNYGPHSRSIKSLSPRLLWEQQYYLVGTISVLRTKAESEHPVEIQPAVIVVDSDDDSIIQHRRVLKRRKRNEIQSNGKAENLNMESPESVIDVEIVDIQPATQQLPFELVQVRTPSQSSTCTSLSVATSRSTATSISSTDFTASTSVSSTSIFGQGPMLDPKNLLEPVDMEFEVAPEFLLNDSQEEQSSPEQGEHSDKDVKKYLKEATGSNPKGHDIDEAPVVSSDEDCCVIVEETEVKKGSKIQEPIVGQGQGHQKTVETAPNCPSTVVQPVRPEAMVEPIVRTDLPACDVAEPRRPLNFQRPLLGERFAQLHGPRVRTLVYDLSISRSFREEPPPYREIEEEEREREQCVYELAQRIEMLRNLPYERPTAQQQMGQGQENQVYQPRDQVVTVINELGPHPINLFGNDNSEYTRNETHRFWDDHANHTPPVLHLPSNNISATRAHQTPPVPRQPEAATCQPLAATNHLSAAVSHHSSTRSQHPSARSPLTSSDYRRENGPHFIPPGQENSDYFRSEENIDPHP